MHQIKSIITIAVITSTMYLSCNQPKTINKEYNNQLTAFLDSIFDDQISDDPEYQTILGITNENSGKWTEVSEERNKRILEKTKKNLDEIFKRFKRERLDEQDKISFDMFVMECEEYIENYPFRHHKYWLNQMEGPHSGFPSFLINMHQINNEIDAEHYLKRLGSIKKQFEQITIQMKISESKGIIPPSFVFPMVKDASLNVIKGYPFDKNNKNVSPIYEDFESKINSLKINKEQKDLYLKRAERLLLDTVKVAYINLMNYWDELEKKSSDEDGCWKFPDGGKFYAQSLKNVTTTSLSPDEIHNIGLNEVKRIHEEMKAIMQKVKFKGTLKDFFEFMRNDKQFYYPENEIGKKAYRKDTEKIINDITAKLDELFITKPKAKMEVKPVETFREKTAGGAFYEEPALDGSRPGRYYINLYTLKDQPNYQMEALAYHEAIPGHHMQIAIAQELENLPKFRKLGGNTAYIEGWGLYSELIPKEIGFYLNPYSDFGRLAMEVFRASRLVVDTGIHYKKWSRKQAYQYMLENTPNPPNDCQKEIDRYIVWPGQATGYKIGMITILKLREKCKNALQDKFDIKQFHEIILTNGPIPLNILEQKINEYISKNKS